MNWCRRVDSNHRPKAYESFALPLSYVGAGDAGNHTKAMPTTSMRRVSPRGDATLKASKSRTNSRS